MPDLPKYLPPPHRASAATPHPTALATAVGRRIRDARKAAGMTGTVLAATAGITQGAISQIEHGHYVPNTATLWKIARALGLTMDSLFPAGGPR